MIDDLKRELVELETEFEERLLPLLYKAVSGQNDLIFLVSRYYPSAYPEQLEFDPAEDLLALGDEILDLRAELGESLEDSLAYRYEEYCRKFCELSTGSRISPQSLAEQFLTELGQYHVFEQEMK